MSTRVTVATNRAPKGSRALTRDLPGNAVASTVAALVADGWRLLTATDTRATLTHQGRLATVAVVVTR